MKVIKVFVDRWSFLYLQPLRESSSVGRARPCQGRGRGFESRFSLQMPPTGRHRYFGPGRQVRPTIGVLARVVKW